MTLFDNRAEARQRLIRMEGLVHVRGNVSTTVFPKQAYKMTLSKLSPGKHSREADLSLLGMPREDGEWPDSSQQDPALKLTLFRSYIHRRLTAMDDFASSLAD